jgi:uncharacterized protein YeaO (DUF488 family)
VQPDIRVRRVYDDPAPQDGARVLVDRVWPRGLRKDAARLDEWARDVAPSTVLRTWYGHDPAKFGEFLRRRYAAELAGDVPHAALGRLRALAAAGPVTLLTATRDIDHSQAAVLAQILRHGAGGHAPQGQEDPAGNPQPGTGERERAAEPAGEPSEGGDAACWAHLVCPECGAVISGGHRPGCTSGPAAPGAR